MQPRALLGLGALALAAALTAVLALRPAAEPTASAPSRRSATTTAQSGKSSSTSPQDRPRTLGDALQALGQPREPEMRLPPAEARVEAEASFEHIMQTLETLADAGERLPVARRDELYRNTNDAFSALSASLDPQSPADMQLLEDANIRMKAMLHELGVRVPRRPPLGEP
jgi:hypothetical protein